VTDRDVLIRSIREARFTAVRLREGYDMRQVDELLDRLVAAIESGQDVTGMLDRARFAPVRLREGYATEPVDRLLAEVRAAAAGGIEGPVQRRTPREDLARRIQEVAFTPVRLREGYDMGQVDALLDRLIAAVERGEDVSALVDGARFVPVRLREGYDMGEVDQFLASVRRGGVEDGPTDPGGRPAALPTRAGASAHPSVIEQRRGFFARLFRR
jgi:DivIVA domain-containing protein